MKFIRFSLLVNLAATAFLLSLPGSQAPFPTAGDRPCRDCSELLVKFKPGASAYTTAQVHRQNGARVVGVIPGIEVQVVQVPADRAMAVLAAYQGNPLVDYAEVNGRVQAAAIPNDPGFDQQWGLTKIKAPEAWDITRGRSDIRIAILDTGIDLEHPDLATKVVAGATCDPYPPFPPCQDSAAADDKRGHGTHIAGIAAAITNNGIGVAGVGYKSSLMSVKVINDLGDGNQPSLSNGILWAADHGAHVISISFIGGGPSQTLENAVNYAWGKGVVVVVAAGNNDNDTPTFPGYYANAIAVAATEADDTRRSTSSYGDWVDVAAPGGGIYSTWPVEKGSYAPQNGTSQAAPFVAGLAALLFSVVSDTNGNGFLNDEVRAAIENNADNIGVSGIGHGRINAYRAVRSVLLGSISGVVRDISTSAPIEGAKVGDGTRETTTNSQGGYIISAVPAGAYAVTASAPGYRSASQNITVSAGGTATANFFLVPVGTLLGDANQDGAVNATDITKVERIILTLDAVTPGADVNQDGAVNILDVTIIERIIIGAP